MGTVHIAAFITTSAMRKVVHMFYCRLGHILWHFSSMNVLLFSGPNILLSQLEPWGVHVQIRSVYADSFYDMFSSHSHSYEYRTVRTSLSL